MSFKHTPPSGLTWELQHVNGAHLEEVFALKTRKEEKNRMSSCKQGENKGRQAPLDR